MKSNPGIYAFNSGELGAALLGRSDIKQYATGCARLENFIPMVQGPARRRPGSVFVGEVRDSFVRTPITEFVRSVQNAFTLEWGDYSLRFWRNDHTQVTVGSPNWGKTVGSTTVDGALTWTNRGFPQWQFRGAVATLWQVILDPFGTIQLCVVAGATSTNLVAWNQVYGQATQDGAAVWAALSPTWMPSSGTVANSCVLSAYGVQQVTSAGGVSGLATNQTPYTIATPYAAADLFDANDIFQLVYCQSVDVIYFVHRSSAFSAYKLSHFADTNWKLVPLDPIGGPFADQNPGVNPIVFASAQTGTGITLSASSDIFAADLVGALFQLTQQNIRQIPPWESGVQINKRGARRRYNGVTYEAVDGATALPWTTGTVPPSHISGAAGDGMKFSTVSGPVIWEYRDPGYGLVRLTARGANPTGAAVVITGITAAKPPVVTTSSPTPAVNGDLVFITGVLGMTEINDKFYRIAAKVGNTFHLQIDQLSGGPVNVDGQDYDNYISGGTADNRVWTATADVIVQPNAGTVNRLPQTVVGSQNATSIWAVGAWNDRDGYPTACAFFRGRLCFARRGQEWISVAQDFENFSALTPNALVTADMAINITLPTQDEIHWLVEGRVEIAGTESAQHSIQEINPSQALGPANVSTKRQLKHGTRGVTPAVVGGSLLWAQTSGIKLRAMKYDFGADNYASEDLNALHDTITQTGIIGLCYQQEPDSVVWMWTRDGRLIGLTFNEEQQVTAWHRHPFAGQDVAIEGACVIPAMDGSQDELWLVVSRTINNMTKRYIEYLAPHFLAGDDIKHAVYVDSASMDADGSTGVVNGLSHLEGQTVKVLADGSTHPDCVVTAGQITLQRKAPTVQVGLTNTALLQTLPTLAEINGTAQGKTKRVVSVMLRLLNTVGGEFGDLIGGPNKGEAMDVLEMRSPSMPLDEPVPPYSDIFPPETYDMRFPAGYDDEARMTYRNTDPLPATVAAIYPSVTTE